MNDPKQQVEQLLGIEKMLPRKESPSQQRRGITLGFFTVKDWRSAIYGQLKGQLKVASSDIW